MKRLVAAVAARPGRGARGGRRAARGAPVASTEAGCRPDTGRAVGRPSGDAAALARRSRRSTPSTSTGRTADSRRRRPVRHADGARSTTATRPGARSGWPCSRCRRPGRGSGRWWSTPAVPASPARRTPPAGRRSSATRCSSTSTSSASTRAAPATARPVDCLERRRAGPLPGRQPGPDDAGRGGGVTPRQQHRLRRPGAAGARVTWPPTSRPWRRRATWTSCGPPSGDGALSYLGGVVRHEARRDLRPALPAAGSAGSSSTARSTRLARHPCAHAPAGRRLPDARSTPTPPTASQSSVGCFLGKTVRRRRADHQHAARPDRRAPAAGRRPAAHVGDAYYGVIGRALQPSLLARAQRRRCGLRSSGDGSLLMRLADAYADRNSRRHLPEQLHRGATPTSPASTTRSRSRTPRCRSSSRRSTRRRRSSAGVFAWSLTIVPRASAPRSDEPVPTIHAAGRRADRRGRHHPRPGHAVPLGGRARPPARLRRADHPRRRRPHRLPPGNACIDHAVESYLVSGDGPARRHSC